MNYEMDVQQEITRNVTFNVPISIGFFLYFNFIGDQNFNEFITDWSSCIN